MNQRRDLTWAVGERERTRRRIRRVTVTVGTASLATAAVVAYYLPRPAHVTVTVHEPVVAPKIDSPTVADARALAKRIEDVVRAGVRG